MLSLVDASTRNTFRAEQSQVVVNQLQTEMEQIKRIPFEEVALTAAPTHSTDPDRPGMARVRQPVRDIAETAQVCGRWSTTAARWRRAERSPDGTLSPAPTPFESGDVSGTIHRYVVWVNDPKCPEALCPGAQDLKRVIVAATLDDTASGGDAPPTRSSRATSSTRT